MMDIPEVWQQTWTSLCIRPTQWTDDTGLTTFAIRVEVQVDAVMCGQGTGRTLGEAIVAAGLDMMGLDGALLPLALELLREKRETLTSGDSEEH